MIAFNRLIMISAIGCVTVPLLTNILDEVFEGCFLSYLLD